MNNEMTKVLPKLDRLSQLIELDEMHESIPKTVIKI